MTTTVEEFIKDKQPVAKVTMDDTITSAVKRMIGDDYGQLPIVNSENIPIGIITSESILKALNNYATTLGGIRVKHAKLEKPQTFNQNIDLLDLFEKMSGDIALVEDDDGKLVQIITHFDTARYFQQRAEDIIRVENIETLLKDFVQLAFSSDHDGESRLGQLIQSMTDSSYVIRQKFEKGVRHYLGQNRISLDDALFDQVFEKQLFEEGLRSYLRLLPEETKIDFDEVSFNKIFEKHFVEQKQPAQFDDLSLGQYISLFLHKAYWPRFEEVFELEKNSVANLLEEVRKTRNDLSHFREITSDQSLQLRDCYNLLNEHQEAINVALAPPSETEDYLFPDEIKEAATDIIPPTDDEPVLGDSRYAPLAIWLQNQPRGKDLIKTSFDEIEKIIEGKLPDSAYENRSWWANDSVGHVQSKQWLDVGWRVDSVNMTNQIVKFARIKERQKAYIDFYSILINKLRQEPGFGYLKTLPDGANWDWVKNVRVRDKNLGYFNYSFGRGGIFRLELYIDSGDAVINKRIFDGLEKYQEGIETAIGHELTWQRLDEKRASRISRNFKAHITDTKEELAELQQKAVPAMVNFIRVMEPKIEMVAKEIL